MSAPKAVVTRGDEGLMGIHEGNQARRVSTRHKRQRAQAGQASTPKGHARGTLARGDALEGPLVELVSSRHPNI